MELTINGVQHAVADNPDDMLLWVLRDELGMIGTKFGCGIGICGACTVHVDGVATRACITPLAAVVDADIVTIEGLADGATLHPVQEAFVAHQVPQCGWCMSGQIMTAAAFLATNATPAENEITEAMGDNYCRCGCYVRIKEAVTAAAAQMAAAQMAATPASVHEVSA